MGLRVLGFRISGCEGHGVVDHFQMRGLPAVRGRVHERVHRAVELRDARLLATFIRRLRELPS